MENLEKFEKIININILKELLRRGLKIELIGKWIWVTGHTLASKNYLKSNGFKWNPNKMAWSYHQGKRYYKKSNKNYTLQELRESFN